MFSSVSTIWVLFSAALVFFMQAGFAMVETGFTRAKNAGNIIMKNLIDFCLGSVAYWLIGFGIMFGDLPDFGALDMGWWMAVPIGFSRFCWFNGSTYGRWCGCNSGFNHGGAAY